MDGVKYIFENGCSIILTDKEAKRMHDYLHTIYANNENDEEFEDEDLYQQWSHQQWNSVFDEDLEEQF